MKMKHTIALLFTRPVEKVNFIIAQPQEIFSQTVGRFGLGKNEPIHKVKL
jgi:hypothetical protein